MNTLDPFEIAGKRIRILIVDDNEAIHADFRKTLAPPPDNASLNADEAALFGATIPYRVGLDMNFQIDSAMQGQQALAMVESAISEGWPYSLAFVDMRMPPGWDGVQTIERIWQADPDLQVIICSAYADYSWTQIAERLGPGDRLLILKKPFDEAEVSQAAVAMTEKWRVTRQARQHLSHMEALVNQRTEELKAASLRDRLTGLPNRDLLNDRLAQAIRRHQRMHEEYALLFIDFDRFKVVNDSLGHEAGDRLLVLISERLRSAVREIDTLASPGRTATAARLGGDEFILLLEHLRVPLDATRVAERLLQVLSNPYEINGHPIHSTASIGITTSAIPYASPDQPIRDADTAMYRAKAGGKGRYVVFDQAMHAQAVARLTLESDLRLAMGNNEFYVEYQPIVSLESGIVAGFEVLCRWHHPRRGIISPVEFIPVVEELGLIGPLGAWVFEESCRQLVEWQRRRPEFRDLFMSVNLSRRQLLGRDVVAEIEATLARTGANTENLKLEITESTMMVDADQAIHVLERIRGLGIRLHMDDFGTGYSSLSCLHKFPISGLKIDRAFVINATERRDYATVVNAIVTLGHSLRMELVAEGVETPEQVAMLQAMNCDQGQGFFFSKPMPAREVEAYVMRSMHPVVAAA